MLVFLFKNLFLFKNIQNVQINDSDHAECEGVSLLTLFCLFDSYIYIQA